AGAPPCTGTPNEPVISEPGNFCAYRGTNQAGFKEKSGAGPFDRNVQGLTGCGTTATPKACTGVETAPFFAGFNGIKILETNEAGAPNEGDEGVLIVFRTTKFSTTTPEALPAGEEGNLNAVGAWALEAP